MCDGKAFCRLEVHVTQTVRLRSPADLHNPAMLMRLVALRSYTLGLAFLFVLIAYLFFSRPRSGRIRTGKR